MDHKTSAIIKIVCFFGITIMIGFIISDIHMLSSN
jgi:hypothetical protein